MTGMMRLEEKQLFRGLDKVFHRSPFEVASLSFRPEQDNSRDANWLKWDSPD